MNPQGPTFEGGEFDVTAATPEDAEAARLAAKVLAYMTADADEWRIEAFKAAQAESPGRWPSWLAVKAHFERFARQHIENFRDEAQS